MHTVIKEIFSYCHEKNTPLQQLSRHKTLESECIFQVKAQQVYATLIYSRVVRMLNILYERRAFWMEQEYFRGNLSNAP